LAEQIKDQSNFSLDSNEKLDAVLTSSQSILKKVSEIEKKETEIKGQISPLRGPPGKTRELK
jgi:hypothetical protein